MKSRNLFVMPIPFLFLAVVLLLQGMVACSTIPKSVQPQETSVREIKNIQVNDLSDLTEIMIESDQPLIYTAYQLSDPDRLVLDLSNGALGIYTEEIKVESGVVQSVQPSQTETPTRVARLEIGLSQPADFRIDQEDTKLIVRIAKPIKTSDDEERMGTTTPEAPAVSTTGPPAQNVTQVRVEPQPKGIRVMITGDGVLSPQVFTLKGHRLVADFPETTNQVKPNVMSVDHALLKRIRLGQHTTPKKVRLVMDLTTDVTYEVKPLGHEVMLDVMPASKPMVSEAGSEVTQTKSSVPPAQAAPSPEPLVPSVTAQKEITPQTVPLAQPESSARKFTGRRISLDFQDADVTNVLRLIADVSGLNIVLGDDVKGKITLKLQNVPWDQVLDLILRSKGLGQIREGNIIRIDTNANIAKQQDEEARAKESLIKAEDLVTQILPVNYSKAQALSTTLRKNLSPRGDITVDESTNTLIVKDIPKNLDEISRLVKILDRQTPQVLIESRIVIANTNFARDIGVQWGAAAANLTGNNRFGLFAGPTGDFGSGTPNPSNTDPNPASPISILPPSAFAVDLPAIGEAGSLGNVGFTFGKFIGRPVVLDLRLSAGETTGETRILSSPKILTLDNKEAVIQQGESIPFQTVSQNGTQTQFVDATLNLTVTPHITPDGSIIMKIKATKNSPGATRSSAGPSIDKREVTTEVLVKDGETTVIGGVLDTTNIKSEEGIPWFRKIPVIGWLFKRESKSDRSNELLIFITPTIVKS